MLPPKGAVIKTGRIAMTSAGRLFCAVLAVFALGIHEIGFAQTAPQAPDAIEGQSPPGVEAYLAGDLSAAREAFKAEAQKGQRLGQFNYAMMMIREEADEETPHEAVRWLTLSAQQGFAPAQYALALLFEAGERVEKSLAKSLFWLEKAARQGHTGAQVAVATSHYIGRGTPLDMAKAFYWYEKAAQSGDVASQYIVARMYESGDGAPKDLEKALDWYIEAARQGDEAAQIKAKELTQRLTDQKNTL